MKLGKIIVILLSALCITACSSEDKQNNNNTFVEQLRDDIIILEYKESNFLMPSNNTIKYSEKYLHQFDNEKIEIIPVNEITLSGNKPVYILENNIVKYKDKQFVDLYHTIQMIDKPCSSEALTNFIVEYFSPRYNIVNVLLETYEINNELIEDSGDADCVIEGVEELDTTTDIYKMSERYGTNVTWCLKIYDVDGSGVENGYIKLYGCRDYIIGYNLDREISKRYETVEIEETEITVDNTESETEDTILEIEETEITVDNTESETEQSDEIEEETNIETENNEVTDSLEQSDDNNE